MPISAQYFANGILHHNSGKTLILVRAMMNRAVKAPNSNHIIFRYRQNAVRASVWMDTLPTVVRMSFGYLKLTAQHWLSGPMILTLPNGSRIFCSGLDEKERVEKILGTEFSTIFFNECSQIPYYSVTTALTRLAEKTEYEIKIVGTSEVRRGTLVNRAYYDLNPVGKTHYTHRLFIQHMKVDNRESLEDPENYASMFLNPIDNAENIDPEYIKAMQALPERHKQRYLLGRYVDELEGALWTLERLEKNRITNIKDLPDYKRVVVAVDPSGASGPDSSSDPIGIVAVAKGSDGHAYVLRDKTLLDKPERWAHEVCELFKEVDADKVIGEANYGGDMVRAVIHMVSKHLPYEHVTASRGKVVRAEPIAALYDMGMVHHVGMFPELEDEMCGFTRDGYTGERSPNRCDAMIWAVTALFPELESHGLIEVWKKQAAEAKAATSTPDTSTPEEKQLSLAEAQKKAEGTWMDKVRGIGGKGIAKVRTVAQTPVCSACGNHAVQQFQDIWRCNCGASGPMPKLGGKA